MEKKELPLHERARSQPKIVRNHMQDGTGSDADRQFGGSYFNDFSDASNIAHLINDKSENSSAKRLDQNQESSGFSGS